MSGSPIVQQKQVTEKPVYRQTTTVINGRYEHHMNAMVSDMQANQTVGSKLEIQRQIRAHNQKNASFAMTSKLFLHKINHHQMVTFLGCIPLPIPCLCTIHGSVYYLYNSNGEVYPSLVLDVPDTNPCALCKFCCTGWSEVKDLLTRHGYRPISTTKGGCTIDHSHDKIPHLLNSAYGCQQSCIMCRSCVSVTEYEAASPPNRT
jgi:hypothetical protein